MDSVLLNTNNSLLIHSFPQRKFMHPLIFPYAFSNFAIGCGVMIVHAMLNDISTGLNVSISKMGLLSGLAACVMAIGAPLVAALTSQIERRKLLMFSMSIYSLGHFLCALAPNYEWLLPLRMFSVLGAAIFTPQAAATLGVVIPVNKRGQAISSIFLGWSVASVLGMPIGNLLGAYLGWRSGFIFISVISLISVFWIAKKTPRELYVPKMSRKIWKGVFKNKILLSILFITCITSAGISVLGPYMAVFLKKSLNAEPTLISFLFLISGACGVLGNLFLSKKIDKFDAGLANTIACLISVLGYSLWLLAYGNLIWSIGVIVITGIVGFAMNSAQQVRLINVDINVGSASIALNSSMIYLGQAIGAFLGSYLILRLNGFYFLPLFVAFLILIGALVSYKVTSYTRNK